MTRWRVRNQRGARLRGAALQIAELDAYAIFRAAARAETKRRICQAYGVLDTEEELFIRLRGETRPAQDLQRDLLRETVSPADAERDAVA